MQNPTMVPNVSMPVQVRGGQHWHFRLRVLLALLSCVFNASALHAAPDESVSWHFDAAGSGILFQLSALGVVPIRGTFDRFTGNIWREGSAGLFRVEMRIDAQSLSMPSGRYRTWARSEEFFDVDRYPEIFFRSDPIPWSVVSNGGNLSGQLTVRGEQRQVEFEILPGDCTRAATVCVLHVTGDINRTRFGMRSRRLALSSRVYLDMRFKAVARPADAAGDAPLDQEADARR